MMVQDSMRALSAREVLNQFPVLQVETSIRMISPKVLQHILHLLVWLVRKVFHLMISFNIWKCIRSPALTTTTSRQCIETHRGFFRVTVE